MASFTLPLPGVDHGKRILTTVIEQRAKNDADDAWVSVPIDDTNLSLGYQDITFKQLNNAANHVAHWLIKNLPSSERFECFAYAGPKDLRYPILAVAAAKVQKVMVLPSPLVTAEAQLQILEHKGCTLYLRPEEMAEPVAGILEGTSHIQTITVPNLGQFLNDTEASPITYPNTWMDGKDDPWLVFHTSGTTGNPKPVTYTHQMMAAADVAASLPNNREGHAHQYAKKRWYTPLPSLHFVGMFMALAVTSFIHMTAVIGPPGNSFPDVVADVLRHGNVNGAQLPPALIDSLCLTTAGLKALRDLDYVHYAGAPLSAKSAELLIPYVQIVPCIGSTEAGPYLTVIHNRADAWDYISFEGIAGAVFESRVNNLHELVFVRDPNSSMQQIFSVYPDLDRFETKDLWVEHPVHRGLWKIVGRSDDYVYLSHGDGLHASLLEPEITAHPKVRQALIGGHGRPAPVLLVELVENTEDDESREDFQESLRPYVEKVNLRCHKSVQISLERVIIASREKPFSTTIKGSVARMQTEIIRG